jgi:hypothetical protein
MKILLSDFIARQLGTTIPELAATTSHDERDLQLLDYANFEKPPPDDLHPDKLKFFLGHLNLVLWQWGKLPFGTLGGIDDEW